MTYGYYGRHAATAEAKRYLKGRDAEKALVERAQNEDQRLVRSRAWLAAWNEKHNPVGNGLHRNTETTDDHQDRREASGPQAAEGNVGQGVGDAAREEAAGGPPERGSDQGESLDWTKGDPLPF